MNTLEYNQEVFINIQQNSFKQEQLDNNLKPTHKVTYDKVYDLPRKAENKENI